MTFWGFWCPFAWMGNLILIGLREERWRCWIFMLRFRGREGGVRGFRCWELSLTCCLWDRGVGVGLLEMLRVFVLRLRGFGGGRRDFALSRRGLWCFRVVFSCVFELGFCLGFLKELCFLRLVLSYWLFRIVLILYLSNTENALNINPPQNYSNSAISTIPLFITNEKPRETYF